LIESNHYNTLNVSPNATAEEIKKAYRKLALQFHPDVAGDDVTASKQFREIKTAYDVLGNSKTREAYHYKYFYKNFKTQPIITADSIAEQAKELAAFAKVLDPYRISDEGLFNQILQLLTDYNLTLLKQANDAKLNQSIIASLISCTQLLSYDKVLTINKILLSLAGEQIKLVEMINNHSQIQKRIHYWEKYKLLLAVAITFLLCVAMYFLVK